MKNLLVRGDVGTVDEMAAHRNVSRSDGLVRAARPDIFIDRTYVGLAVSVSFILLPSAGIEWNDTRDC